MIEFDFSGECLPEEQRAHFEQTVNNHWTAGHIKKIIMDVKCYNKGGTKSKCSISIEAHTDFGYVNVDADTWDFKTCVRDAIKKLEKQIQERKEKASDKSHMKSQKKESHLHMEQINDLER